MWILCGINFCCLNLFFLLKFLLENTALAPDGFWHPVKKIKGCLYKTNPKTGQKALYKRCAWPEGDILAEDVNCPDLKCRGWVNPKRVVSILSCQNNTALNRINEWFSLQVVDYTDVPEMEKAVKNKNPPRTCQFCKQEYSHATTCDAHELKCQAPGSLRHRCGPSCEENCLGRISMENYERQPDRRANNRGRPKKN